MEREEGIWEAPVMLGILCVSHELLSPEFGQSEVEDPPKVAVRTSPPPRPRLAAALVCSSGQLCPERAGSLLMNIGALWGCSEVSFPPKPALLLPEEALIKESRNLDVIQPLSFATALWVRGCRGVNGCWGSHCRAAKLQPWSEESLGHPRISPSASPEMLRNPFGQARTTFGKGM